VLPDTPVLTGRADTLNGVQEVNRNDPRPPYVQIADDLRRAVAVGELAPGERLDPVRKLASRYAVAPTTLQNALNVLRAEGLVVTWQGRGLFVAGGETGSVPRSESVQAAAAVAARLDALQAEVADLRSRVVALEASR
jgi:DNA-binding GntR family transcriptional regulator